MFHTSQTLTSQGSVGKAAYVQPFDHVDTLHLQEENKGLQWLEYK